MTLPPTRLITPIAEGQPELRVGDMEIVNYCGIARVVQVDTTEDGRQLVTFEWAHWQTDEELRAIFNEFRRHHPDRVLPREYELATDAARWTPELEEKP
jgi:hypothetical protein